MPDYDILRFLNDDSFLNYCFDRNKEDMLHWEKWLENNPDQRIEITRIKKMVVLLGYEAQKKEIETGFDQLREKIDRANEKEFEIVPGRSYTSWLKTSVAASVILILSVGTYIFFQKKSIKDNTQQIAKHVDIVPGQNQATLTLANGRKIIINNNLKGQEIQIGNSIVKISNDSTLSLSTKTDTKNPLQYNTFSTAKGEQSPFPLRLADGTKVWLNAESSITFPSVFNTRERVVKIKGEAYFDVVHNEKSPFKVMVKGQTIEDIGTTFNINSYDDEPNIRTTLISGSARVITDKGKSVIINPNQMATIISSEQITVARVNAQNAVDWKNGVFMFDKEPLESVMRKIARWYDVDIVYSGNEKIEEVFGGSITRYANVSQVLKVLEVTGDVHFKIEGRKIIVSKK